MSIEEEEPWANTPISLAYGELAKHKERYRVLGECLLIRQALKRSFSQNENNLTPKSGYEGPFEEEEMRIACIQGMMREESTGIDAALREIAGLQKGAQA